MMRISKKQNRKREQIEVLPVQQFEEISRLIKETRKRALSAANKELINLYWKIGKYISGKVESSEWGDKTVRQLSEYLKINYPEFKGFSIRGLYRMKQFYETYCDFQNVSPLVTQLSWTNNMIIFSRCKTPEEREFYIKLAIKESYSKRELERQINTSVFERTILADKKLPPAVKELSSDTSFIFRDQYLFEFLDLPEKHSENDLRLALIANLKKFILELGRDFAFIGEEYRVQVGNKDFSIDLLFFNRDLQSLVAVDLKIDDFKPEYLGKIEFYLEALDRDVKKPQENPSIGILLCKGKDDEVVEYALSRSMSPTVIADYETKLIPKKLLQQKLHEFYELAKSDKSINNKIKK